MSRRLLASNGRGNIKRWVRVLVYGFVAIAAVIGTVQYINHGSSGHPSALVPVDPVLRQPWLYFYPSRTTTPAVGVILFVGNDIAFRAPHQDLAWRLSGDGYGVIGLDVRAFLSTLPESEPQRDSTFGVEIAKLMVRARHELHADSLPMIVGGHSFGAEVALWIARYQPPPRLVGVLELNISGSGHLFITAADLLMSEASGPDSFSTLTLTATLAPQLRIALVRGANDPFRHHDIDFVRVGGARLRRFEVPLAGHGLKSMIVAGPIISKAVRFLMDSTAR